VEEAKQAVKTCNGYKLDKNHVFIVNMFADFDKYTNVEDEWTPPQPLPFKDTVCFLPHIRISCVGHFVSRKILTNGSVWYSLF